MSESTANPNPSAEQPALPGESPLCAGAEPPASPGEPPTRPGNDEPIVSLPAAQPRTLRPSPGDKTVVDSAAAVPLGALPESVLLGATRKGASFPLVPRFPDIPGYTILEQLGIGGMGVVYKARQSSLNRLVALKMVLAGDRATPEDRVRFLVEAEAVGKLRHPNIVQIYDLDWHDGHLFFAMEFVEGGSLAERVRQGPLPAAQAAHIVEQVARGVHHSHQQNILHRDLKPANILLTADGTPKITDFGLARMMGIGEGMTLAGSILGTPSYMSPEQATGQREKFGPTIDVYALGAILYCLLTGKPPFLEAQPIDTLQKVRDQEPASPRSIVPGIPRDLETICLKCLEKKPEHRYPSAAALADDLHRWREGQPIHARPPTWNERCRKWLCRHRRGAELTGVALAAFVIAWMFQELRTLSRSSATPQANTNTTAQAASPSNELSLAQWYRDSLRALLLHPGSESIEPRPIGPANPAWISALDRLRQRLEESSWPSPMLEADLRRELAEAYCQAGALPLAERQAREALRLCCQVHAESAPATEAFVALWADLATQCGQFAEVEARLAPLIRQLDASQPQAGQTSRMHLRWGRLLCRQQRYADAETELLRGYHALASQNPTTATDRLWLKHAANWLAELYQATNRPQEAARWGQP